MAKTLGFTIVYPRKSFNWFWYFAVCEELRGKGITFPPCFKHEEYDAEDYDDDNNASNITHKSYI